MDTNENSYEQISREDLLGKVNDRGLFGQHTN